MKTKDAPEERSQAKFFSGLEGYIRRLDVLFEQANIASIRRDLYVWRETLACLYRELLPKMGKGEPEKLKQDVFKALSYKAMPQTRIFSNEHFTQLYPLLFNLDCDLRQTADKAGLLMQDKETKRTMF